MSGTRPGSAPPAAAAGATTNVLGQLDMPRRLVAPRESVFKLPISNTLGIDAIEARARLKNFALQEPAAYTEFRNEVYISVLRKMTEEMHSNIWNMLASGMLPGGAQMNIKGTPWAPHLPDQEIGRLANGMAESMMKSFDEIMDRVLPDDYKSLADDKLMNIAKVNGVDRAIPGQSGSA
jgi:hypothetical protein